MGRSFMSTKHITISGKRNIAFAVMEYTRGDVPSGAYDAKNTTPDIMWQIYLVRNARRAEVYLCPLMSPHRANAMYGRG